MKLYIGFSFIIVGRIGLDGNGDRTSPMVED